MLYRQSNALTLDDYKCLVAIAQRLQPKRMLEFGPGFSTYAWIEAGVPEIVTLECHDEWRGKKEAEFADYPSVTVLPYWNEAPEARVPEEIGEFDLAFVDSPRGQGNPDAVVHPGQEDYNRLNTLITATKLSPVTIIHDAVRVRERNSLAYVEKLGFDVHYINVAGRSYGIAQVICPKHAMNLSTKPSETSDHCR